MLKDTRNGGTTGPALNEKNAISISEALEMLDDAMISEIRRILVFLVEHDVKIRTEILKKYEEEFAKRIKVEESKLEFAKFYSSNNPISDDHFNQLRECLRQLEEIVKPK